jgi:PleD family two-component response regulator
MNSIEKLEAVRSDNRHIRKTDVRTVLIIDNGRRERRKERIIHLKDAGFKVHPARSFEQSLSRVGSGAYDLVIANTEAAGDSALRFCNEVKRNYPRQKLLVLKPTDMEMPGEFAFSTSDAKTLFRRAQEMFPSAHLDEPAAA